MANGMANGNANNSIQKTDSNNDLFEEFEFKPLTSGLGFHKKENKNTNSPVQPDVNSAALKKIDFKKSHLNFDAQGDLDLKSPLPRKENLLKETARTEMINQDLTNQFKSESKKALKKDTDFNTKSSLYVPTIEDDSLVKSQSAVNDLLKDLNHKKQTESLQKNKTQIVWSNVTPSFGAAFLDGMLIVAFFLLSLITMLIVTEVDLVANLTQPGDDYGIYIASAALLGVVQFIYYVICRSYIHCTPGEWAFDQRCGNDTQISSSTYILKVIWRSVLNTLTGFILFPLISWIVKYDFLAPLSGVQLQSFKKMH